MFELKVNLTPGMTINYALQVNTNLSNGLKGNQLNKNMWSTDPGWMPIGTVRKISYCSIQYLRNTNKQCIGKLKPQTAHSSNSGSYTRQYMSSVCCWFNQPQCVKQSFLPLLIIYESIFFLLQIETYMGRVLMIGRSLQQIQVNPFLLLRSDW